jgi:MFS family permease
VAGLVATLPMLVGAVFQLVTPVAVRRLGSNRRWVVFCAWVQAASFLPLVAAALLGRLSVGVLFATVAVYWGFGMSTSPAWNTWVGTLVPPVLRARFFAGRARWTHAAVFVGLVSGGTLLELGADAERPLLVFALLFAAAAAARGVSSGFLARQSEPLPIPSGNVRVSPGAFVSHLRGHGHGRLLAFMLALTLTVHIAAPFFTPYMLGPLALSYAEYMSLTAVSFAARILVLPLLGRLAHRAGTRRVLRVGGLAVIPLPALWLVSSDFRYLFVLQTAAGVSWAAFELATLLGFFESIPERDRTSVLSMFNLANAVAIVSGSLLGAALFRALQGSPGAYGWLFLASTASRLLTVPLLRRAEQVLPPPPRALPLRTLAVRPSADAVERPILAGIEDEEAGQAGAAGR